MSQKKSVEEIVQKKFPEFVEVAMSMSVDEMEQRMLAMAKDRVRVREARSEDEQLLGAKAVVAELDGPYKDTLEAIDIKSRYLSKLISERGTSAGDGAA